MRIRRGCALAAVSVLVVVAGCAGTGSDDPSGTGGDADRVSVERVPGATYQPDAAALDPSGERLVVPCRDGLCLWRTSDGTLESTWAGGSLVAWSPSGDLVATDGVSVNGRAGIVLLDPTTGDEVRTLAGHETGDETDGGAGGVTDLAFSADGMTLATAGTDGTVRLWEVESGTEVAVLRSGGNRPDALAFDPTGERLAVAGKDAPVEVWEVSSEDRLGALNAEPQGEVAWSPDGQTIVTNTREASDAARVILWDAGTLSAREPAPGPVQADQLAFSPDGSRLAISRKDDPTVVVWPVAGGPQRSLGGLTEPVRSVLWSPDARRLYAVDARRGVLAWDLTVGSDPEPQEFEQLR